MPAFIRVWSMAPKRGRCRRCKKPLLWVIDDKAKMRPFAVDATPIRTETDADTGVRLQVYDASTAFHRCPPKKVKRSPRRQAQQTRLL